MVYLIADKTEEAAETVIDFDGEQITALDEVYYFVRHPEKIETQSVYSLDWVQEVVGHYEAGLKEVKGKPKRAVLKKADKLWEEVVGVSPQEFSFLDEPDRWRIFEIPVEFF